MQVKLIDHTQNPEKVVAAAARLCYSPLGAMEIMDNFVPEQVENFLAKLTELGHDSPLEHASFTFAVAGISRACSHQLVRHRIGVSFSQKSQRYVKEKQFEYVTPKSLQKKGQAELFDKVMADLQKQYEILLVAGVPAEDARYVLPNACVTNIVITMNARSLHHFFRLRCCERAQWEIRELANLMLAEVQQVAPTLFAKAGASCDTEGVCYEGKMSCGKAPTIAELQK